MHIKKTGEVHGISIATFSGCHFHSNGAPSDVYTSFYITNSIAVNAQFTREKRGPCHAEEGRTFLQQ